MGTITDGPKAIRVTKAIKAARAGSKGAPGPIAAGLPILLLAGGYALVRRYRRTDEPAERPHA